MAKREEAGTRSVLGVCLLVMGSPQNVFKQEKGTARVLFEENTLTAVWKMNWMEEAGKQAGDS